MMAKPDMRQGVKTSPPDPLSACGEGEGGEVSYAPIPETAPRLQERLSTDVLVIGAGPAGSTAARAAAREGARVLLVERKAQVGVPEQCAGYVSQAIRWHVDLSAECVAQAVGRLRTFLPDGTAHEVEMPGYLLNRAALDRHLALLAVQAGARLLLHTAALDLRDGKVVLRKGRAFSKSSSPCHPERSEASRPTGEKTLRYAQGDTLQEPLQRGGQLALVEARVIVGADGPCSTVARWLGLTPGSAARAIQYEMPLARRLEAAEVFFRPAFRGGYAWLFPAGQRARVGAAFDSDHEEGVEGLHQLLEELQKEGRILNSTLSCASGFVPVGGPRPARRDNLLLVGDAAGHTHPLTGAGILNAIVAGEMAGRAAARAVLSGEEAPLEEYEEELREVLLMSLERAREKRVGLERAWDLPPVELSQAIRESWIAFDEYYSR